MRSALVVRCQEHGEVDVIEHELKVLRYLCELVPAERDHAAAVAVDLAACTRYLPWHDRVRAFDQLFWAEAKHRLSNEDVTAIVNRHTGPLTDTAQVAAYTRFCGATVAATLLLLDEPLQVTDEAAALVHYFSQEAAHREAALDWIGAGHHLGLASRLPDWPGCAFLLLILSPSDSAESFIARDAFWDAMLGRS